MRSNGIVRAGVLVVVAALVGITSNAEAQGDRGMGAALPETKA